MNEEFLTVSQRIPIMKRNQAYTIGAVMLGICSLAAFTSCKSASISASQATIVSGLTETTAKSIVNTSGPTRDLIGKGTNLLVASLLKATIVKDRDDYDDPRDYVRDNNTQLSSRIGEVRSQKKEVGAYIADAKSGKTSPSKSEVRKQSSQVKKNIAIVDQDIRTARSAVKEATPEEKRELEKKIEVLSAERSQMQQQQEELDSLATI